jgi:hypothetical protein
VTAFVVGDVGQIPRSSRSWWVMWVRFDGRLKYRTLPTLRPDALGRVLETNSRTLYGAHVASLSPQSGWAGIEPASSLAPTIRLM